MYMIATKAMHQLGDLSRPLETNLEERLENLCQVNSEDEENYIGSWVTGMGFIHVKFPKKTTRVLTEEEIKEFNKFHLQIGSQPSFKLNIK